jgi:hypothetical protein
MNSPHTRTVLPPRTTGKKITRPDTSFPNKRWNIRIKLLSGRKKLIGSPRSQRGSQKGAWTRRAAGPRGGPQSHSWPLLIALVVCIFPLLLSGAARGQTTKPKLKVAADGLPSGHDTPEGAACDLARSFINRDEKLFSTTSIRLYAGGNGPEAYAKFLQETVQSIKAEAAKKEPSPQRPRSIGKVFAARHLSKSGPVSYGNAAFGFEDIMFVDIGLYLHNGERVMNRTLVIKDRDGKWYSYGGLSACQAVGRGSRVILTRCLRERSGTGANVRDGAVFAAPWLRSGGCVRESRRTFDPLLRACAHYHHPTQSAS